MDTQASQHLILQGGRETASAASALLIECWFYRGYGPPNPLIGDIIQIADSLGFALFEFGDQYRDGNGKLFSKDAVLMKPDLAAVKGKNSFSRDGIADRRARTTGFRQNALDPSAARLLAEPLDQRHLDAI
jgi:hypothetical protein